MIGYLLAAAVSPTAVDAELAFARDAQANGQWTAFRAWSTEDALMFAPQPVKAHDFLKSAKDPPEALKWWPSESYVSCDGGHAVNTGPWKHDSRKAQGYFTTVWVRQGDGRWKWIYDGGDNLSVPVQEPRETKVRKASCQGKPPATATSLPTADGHAAGNGQSRDGTLAWSWTVGPDGSRHFIARLWNGNSFDTVLDQTILPAR